MTLQVPTRPVPASPPAAAPETHRDWLAERPFTLVLSAGWFGFFAHTGLLAALREAGLVPRRIVGVSGGSIAGGLFAAGVPVEMLVRMLDGLDRRAFWDPGIPLGGLLRGRRLAELLRAPLEAAGNTQLEHTPIPFTPVVFDPLRGRSFGLERGPTVDAIRASCAVPFLFRPVWIDRRPLVDGGMRDPLGSVAVDPDERVLLHDVTLDGSSRRAPRAGALAFRTPDLPRVGAFRLEEGRAAFERTREALAGFLAARPDPSS